MKVSINSKFISGPYGGGMQVALSLKRVFEEHGIDVVNTLEDADIDIILHVNPFPFLMQVAQYSFFDAYCYKLRHPNTIIINGIHECDERKGSRYMNKLLVTASKYSDYVVFVASWLVPLLEKKGFPATKPKKVVLNGSDASIFNKKDKEFWDGKRKMRLVTHHWGGHYLKGHDVYQQIDEKLGDPEFAAKYEFTYIGNHPSNITYKKTTVKKPIGGKELAEELKKHDVYVTASRNEPAGLHHIEGALCGLPIVYINSGGIPEYCDGYGISFEPGGFFEALEKMREEYAEWLKKLETYDNTSQKMAEQYYELLQSVKKDKEKFVCKKNVLMRYAQLFFCKLYAPLFGVYMKIKVRLQR